MEELKMSDDVIGHVAKVLQVALLTGTDVVDNLRMMRLKSEDGVLSLHPVCSELFDKTLNEMMTDILMKETIKTAAEEGHELTESDLENARKMMVSTNAEIINVFQTPPEEIEVSEPDINDEDQTDVDQW